MRQIMRWLPGRTESKRRKYGNVKVGGFDSKKESARYAELELMQRAGEITDLRRQVRIELIPKQAGERAVEWLADFVYTENGEEIWEDCKGFRTRDYVIKRKLALWVHGKRIRET